jgi:hypothetical protein
LNGAKLSVILTLRASLPLYTTLKPSAKDVLSGNNTVSLPLVVAGLFGGKICANTVLGSFIIYTFSMNAKKKTCSSLQGSFIQ